MQMRVATEIREVPAKSVSDLGKESARIPDQREETRSESGDEDQTSRVSWNRLRCLVTSVRTMTSSINETWLKRGST